MTPSLLQVVWADGEDEWKGWMGSGGEDPVAPSSLVLACFLIFQPALLAVRLGLRPIYNTRGISISQEPTAFVPAVVHNAPLVHTCEYLQSG